MGIKGYKHTDEARAKISAARQKRLAEDGFLNTPETRAKISATNRGKPSRMSAEGRERLREALCERVRTPEQLRIMQEAAWEANRGKIDEQSPNWLGDAVGYGGLQHWLTRKLGQPAFCEECGTSAAKKYHWVSQSSRRLRDLSDWIRLCRSCHWVGLKREPWNKDKTGYKMGKRPGSRPDMKGNTNLFKPGQTPINKGKPRPEIQGANHPNWKGGVAPVHQMIRASIPYKQWRIAVFERDYFTCVLCGFRSAYHGRGRCDIRADHIKPFHAYPELRFAVDNGRTLCVPCDLAHGWQPWRQTDDENQLVLVRTET